MSLDERFQKAAEDVKRLNSPIGDAELLEVYAYYKQGSLGDCDTAKPGMFDFKGKAKWEAWNGKKGLSKDDAKEAYIKKVQQLIDTVGLA